MCRTIYWVERQDSKTHSIMHQVEGKTTVKKDEPTAGEKSRRRLQDIRWFILFYYITCAAIWAALTHTVAIARTLERR